MAPKGLGTSHRRARGSSQDTVLVALVLHMPHEEPAARGPKVGLKADSDGHAGQINTLTERDPLTQPTGSLFLFFFPIFC